MVKGIIFVSFGIVTVLSLVFPQDSYSNNGYNEQGYDYLGIRYKENKVWLPYVRVIGTLQDQKNILWYKTSIANNFYGSIANNDHSFLLPECCEEKHLFFFNDVSYMGLIDIVSVLPSSAITSAVIKAFNLDLPIFKPIMLPWDYYLRDYDVYLDYKFTLGDNPKNYLLEQIDIKVFYLFK